MPNRGLGTDSWSRCHICIEFESNVRSILIHAYNSP
eukprot:SAG22_NODE_19532_length_274_cov_0.588571_1_plen_35_part_01